MKIPIIHPLIFRKLSTTSMMPVASSSLVLSHICFYLLIVGCFLSINSTVAYGQPSQKKIQRQLRIEENRRLQLEKQEATSIDMAEDFHREDSKYVRASVMQYLTNVGSAAKAATPILVKAIYLEKRPNKKLNQFCDPIHILEESDPTAPLFIKRLVKTLIQAAQPNKRCYKCDCILRALSKGGELAEKLSGPVIKRRLLENYNFIDAELLEQILKQFSPRGIEDTLVLLLSSKAPIKMRIVALDALVDRIDALSDANRHKVYETILSWQNELGNGLKVVSDEYLYLPSIAANSNQSLTELLLSRNPQIVVEALDKILNLPSSEAKIYLPAVVELLNPLLGTGVSAANVLFKHAKDPSGLIANSRKNVPEHLVSYFSSLLELKSPSLAMENHFVGLKNGGGVYLTQVLAKGRQRGLKVGKRPSIPRGVDPVRSRIELKFTSYVYPLKGNPVLCAQGEVNSLSGISPAIDEELNGQGEGAKIRIFIPADKHNLSGRQIKLSCALPKGLFYWRYDIEVQKKCFKVWHGGIFGNSSRDVSCS